MKLLPGIMKYEARLDLLQKKVVGDVVNNPKSVQTYAAEAGSDIIKATTELNKTPHHTNTPPATSACVPGPEDKNADGLPTLPPILDETLEKAVFTHPGLSNNNSATYDRLEILGDAYIELIATKLVWARFPAIPSGRISQIRELLVKNETLSEYATMYGMDSRASVPHGYLDQPKRWTKTKGDIFEAYVAAIILSNSNNGFNIAEHWLTQLWLPRLMGLGSEKSDLQAKEALAKKVMGKGIKLNYVDERAPILLKGGLQTFFIGVYLTGWGWDKKHLGSGEGRNKAMAGDEAARQALLNVPLIDEISATKKEVESKRKLV